MDLDYAKRRITEAPDVPALSDVLLELLDTVGNLDDALAQLKLHVQDLEREIHDRHTVPFSEEE